MSTESVTTSVSHQRRPFPMKTFLLWVGMLPVVFVLIMPVWYMVSKAFTP